jgi:hypothetical protein
MLDFAKSFPPPQLPEKGTPLGEIQAGDSSQRNRVGALQKLGPDLVCIWLRPESKDRLFSPPEF